MDIMEYNLTTLEEFIGRELGTSQWVLVDQARIDAFAACTGDHQWIHTDAARAKRENPYGGTIAHGYLTLSLLAAAAIEVGVIPRDAAAGLNYGLDKVRFMAPVKAGARVRNKVTLSSVEKRDNGRRILLKIANELQIEGEDKPALVAESLVMLVA